MATNYVPFPVQSWEQSPARDADEVLDRDIMHYSVMVWHYLTLRLATYYREPMGFEHAIQFDPETLGVQSPVETAFNNHKKEDPYLQWPRSSHFVADSRIEELRAVSPGYSVYDDPVYELFFKRPHPASADQIGKGVDASLVKAWPWAPDTFQYGRHLDDGKVIASAAEYDRAMTFASLSGAFNAHLYIMSQHGPKTVRPTASERLDNLVDEDDALLPLGLMMAAVASIRSLDRPLALLAPVQGRPFGSPIDLNDPSKSYPQWDKALRSGHSEDVPASMTEVEYAQRFGGGMLIDLRSYELLWQLRVKTVVHGDQMFVPFFTMQPPDAPRYDHTDRMAAHAEFLFPTWDLFPSGKNRHGGPRVPAHAAWQIGEPNDWRLVGANGEVWPLPSDTARRCAAVRWDDFLAFQAYIITLTARLAEALINAGRLTETGVGQMRYVQIRAAALKALWG